MLDVPRNEIDDLHPLLWSYKYLETYWEKLEYIAIMGIAPLREVIMYETDRSLVEHARKAKSFLLDLDKAILDDLDT